MAYIIQEHNHRLAAWDASTSASSSPKCRFKVKDGVTLLESCGFDSNLSEPEMLPDSNFIDEKHRLWRNSLIAGAKDIKINNFTHGVAGKLINSYLKSKFVCGGYHEHPNVKSLHPPIDRVLLKCLADNNIGNYSTQWRKYENIGWSKFSSSEYEEVLQLIRSSIPGRPLWEIEEYWQGYQ